jgi:hypothetical protein
MIVDEIGYVVKKMDKVQEAHEKLYYFSAIFGIIHRIFNIEYSSDLAFAHFILRSTFDTFQSRLKAIQQGDHAVPLNNEQFYKLATLSKDLAEKIKKDENIYDTLKSLACLAYSATGNGYYLMQKGILKI